jgi:hypothetical protein
MTTLLEPPSPYPFDAGQQTNPAIMHVLTNLLAGPRLDAMKLELEDEVAYITSGDGDDEIYKPYYYPTRMYWCGYSGVYMMEKLYPHMWTTTNSIERGLPAKLKHLFSLLPESLQKPGLDEISRIWQHLWSDESIVLHPSTYVNFCRYKEFKIPETPLHVRPFVLQVERARTQRRLDKALLTPKHIRRQTIMNGVRFCWVDYLDNNPNPGATLGMMTHKERAAFVLCQLMLGSRFKGVAQDNEILAVYPDGVLMQGMSKSKDKSKKVTRPVNVSLAQHVATTNTERMEIFYTMMIECRAVYERIQAEREVEGPEELVAMRNAMRKEVRRYIEQAFPGMLGKGEATHLLRKIYLQLAFETYGHGMKETGFAARVFAHEGYATSLHYTSVVIT